MADELSKKSGQITDPPTTPCKPSAPVQYAVRRSPIARSLSPQTVPDATDSKDPVFCDKCLRNQHLVASVLAQYEWPEDPSGAESSAAERKFWVLRKDMEKRYPQVCSECEPRVQKKLDDASYTAQTDHLRRMMDRTRSQRHEVRQRGILDLIDTAGRWTWDMGFFLQFWWQGVVLGSLLLEHASAAGMASWVDRFLRISRRVHLDTLPHGDWVLQWAINLGVCSFLWNPRFKQTVRGFTGHILGFRQWYTYQLLILLLRFICLSLSQYRRSLGMPTAPEIGAQLVIALLMLYVSSSKILWGLGH
jgi:hypothetical protein